MITLIASGDLRLPVNQNCWAAQAAMENLLINYLQQSGCKVNRAHSFDPVKGHGFIDSQHMGTGTVADLPQSETERRWQETTYQ